MGVTSPSARVRARKRVIQRVAERAAFVRERARQAEGPPVEEEVPADGGGDGPAPG